MRIKRVLVIDDDEAVRKVFVLALEGSEFQADTAPSGAEGLAMVRQVDYDLIFLDLKMPEMNGIDTLRQIREIDRTVTIYIITAFSDEYFAELRQAARDGISFELIKKPIGSRQLLEITRGITRGARAV